MSKCIGCGVKLQNKNNNFIGYTPDLDNKYCERCFKTIHYNKEKKIDVIDNLDIINKINELNLFTIFITDIINLNNELIDIYKRINNDKVLVINKLDLIPNNLKISHLKDNIKESYNIKEDIIFISAKNKMNLGSINRMICNKNVCFCGETSSGKSTLINTITGSKLTTSKYDNTTIDFIKIKNNEHFIYDSPGIKLKDNYELKKIKINTKVLNNEYNYIIGDYIINGSGNLTFVLNDYFDIKSKKKEKELKNAMDVPDNSDLLLEGVGFIYVKNKMKIKSNNNISIRTSIIGR